MTLVAPTMDGAKIKPSAVNSAVSGAAVVTVDTETKEICARVQLAPSSFVPTALHIHEGTAAATGVVVQVLPGEPVNGLVTVRTEASDAFLEAVAVKAARYVDAHSKDFRSGEIRDQLVASAVVKECDELIGKADAGSRPPILGAADAAVETDASDAAPPPSPPSVPVDAGPDSVSYDSCATSGV